VLQLPPHKPKPVGLLAVATVQQILQARPVQTHFYDIYNLQLICYNLNKILYRGSLRLYI
jgi:hypothetical protein